MALIRCRDCGYEVSRKAEACPHCGRTSGGTKASTMIMAALLTPAILVIVWFIFTQLIH